MSIFRHTVNAQTLTHLADTGLPIKLQPELEDT